MPTATPRILSLPAARTRAQDWVKCCSIIALLAWLYADTLIDMARDWWNVPAWSQGILLPPLAIYIACIRRQSTLMFPAKNDGHGLALVGFGCLVFLAGRLMAEFFLTRISFVVVLGGLIRTFWGTSRLKTLTFPLLLLAAMVPLPALVYNSLAAPLQLFASDIATSLAQAVGISVHRDGNIIELAGTSLGVAEACSGLNSLSALIVGSLLLGYMLCVRPLSRFVLFAIAVPLAVAINVVRVAATAIVADYNQEFAMGFYHLFSGWLVFIAGFAVLYAIAVILHRILDLRGGRT